jgi:hypothetical protein
VTRTSSKTWAEAKGTNSGALINDTAKGNAANLKSPVDENLFMPVLQFH